MGVAPVIVTKVAHSTISKLNSYCHTYKLSKCTFLSGYASGENHLLEQGSPTFLAWRPGTGGGGGTHE